MKKYIKLFFSRLTLVGLTIVLLILFDFLLVVTPIVVFREVIAYYFPGVAPYVNYAITALYWIVLVGTVLNIANRDMIPETKIPWLLCVVVLNIFGVFLYVVFANNRPSRRNRKRLTALYLHSEKYITKGVERDTIEAEAGHWASVSAALTKANPRSVCLAQTKTQYFPTGELFFERLTEDLKQAKKYIFMEYFILARGKMWYTILDILKQKVQEGVEVRLIYDDIGCMGKIRSDYYRILRKAGIKCVKFNPFVPVVANVHNNRDHRKITVIDGVIGYTGGVNLADEYINEIHPFGTWKDSAVRLEGQGVQSLLLMFLRFYNLSTRQTEDFAPYLPESYEAFEDCGYVQPFGDGPKPLYKSQIGEDVYINILNGAQRYCWIMTPYLIIDYRMREAMLAAAARGVDVRILTPHIPDKKVAFALTRSNYMALIKGGVKIYEYAPGFVHSKSFLADDEVAVVGTINLDYRSLLHHYENAVFMIKTQAVKELKRDYEKTFEISLLQTEEDAKKSVVWRGICELAKVFAPLF